MKAQKSKRISYEFNISLPATSANLGPAFDAAALALDLALRIRAHKSRGFSITASGRDSEICRRVDDHHVDVFQHRLGYVSEPARWVAFWQALAAAIPLHLLALWLGAKRLQPPATRAPLP